jgi:hypothetical protein
MAKNETPLSALMAGLQKARGGKRLTQLRNRVMEAMAYQDTKLNQPRLLSADTALSLGGGPSVIELTGHNLLVPSDVSKKQVVASKRIWDGATPATDNVMLYARFPGKYGNFRIVMGAFAGAAAAVDTDLATEDPHVVLTPKTGDADALVTAINTSSQILRAEKNGVPVLVQSFETALAGGLGDGVKAYLGELLFQDVSQYGPLFGGEDSFIAEWYENMVKLSLHKDDAIAGRAIPAGMTALTAVEGTLLARLEWVRPLFETAYQLHTKA